MASGAWLRDALESLRRRPYGSLELDGDLIDGLVSFCELAPPSDAADYLSNILGVEAGQEIIHGYLERRGFATVDSSSSPSGVGKSNLQAYSKPPTDVATKKQPKPQNVAGSSATHGSKNMSKTTEPVLSSKGNSSLSKKKRGGKVVSLAEAAKGSIVFQQGLPCNCQARRHKLVSNCLSCGKIVCEQEGEGPCCFCGALVLREGSSYAGLTDTATPFTESEAAAEAYAKRLVEYDRDSAARTKVIDDQFEYYEIEGNSWLSAKEKDVLKKKQEEAEEAANKQKRSVIVTFDLVGRKVILNQDEAPGLAGGNFLQPLEERDVNRIRPNPSVKVQAKFIDTGSAKPAKERHVKKLSPGLCLGNTGRVQYESKDTQLFQQSILNDRYSVQSRSGEGFEESFECSADYN